MLFTDDGVTFQTGPRTYRDEAVISNGGPVAEARAGGPGDGNDSDIPHIYGVLHAMGLVRGTSEHKEALDRALSRADEIVRENWDEVQAVARLLVQHATI